MLNRISIFTLLGSALLSPIVASAQMTGSAARSTASVSQGQVTEGAKAIEQLKRDYSQLNSIKADFEQQVKQEDGTILQTVAGHMKVKRPGHFLWQTEDPYPQQIVTNGELIWLFEPDLDQVTIKKLDEQLESTPAVLLSGSLEGIETHFKVTHAQIDASTAQYQLFSLDKEASFKQFSLTFKQGLIHQMVLFDHLGQVTDIQFSDVVHNSTIPSSLFSFVPPEGVDIIRD